MVFVVCPQCKHGFEHVASKRVCFDCKQPIGRHDKWTLKVRSGVATPCHRDCKHPAGGKGFEETT